MFGIVLGPGDMSVSRKDIAPLSDMSLIWFCLLGGELMRIEKKIDIML